MPTSPEPETAARLAARAEWLDGLGREFRDCGRSARDLEESDRWAVRRRGLYERRGYDESRIAFRAPTDAERKLYALEESPWRGYQGPGWNLLVVDGEPTGFHYVRGDHDRVAFSGDGPGFDVVGGGRQMGLRDEDDARRMAVMLYDAATRGFDRDLAREPLLPGEEPWAGRRRFVAREDIGDAVAAVGYREGKPLERVGCVSTIHAGTMVLRDASGTYAVLDNHTMGWSRVDLCSDLDGRFAEVPLTPTWAERADSPHLNRHVLDRFPADSPHLNRHVLDRFPADSPAVVTVLRVHERREELYREEADRRLEALRSREAERERES